MSSILSRAMLPAAVAIAMLSFIGALGAGSIRNAQAVEGDVCQVYTNAPSKEDFDGQGNTVYLVNRGVTYGLVFRIEDDEEMALVDTPLRLANQQAAADAEGEEASAEDADAEDADAEDADAEDADAEDADAEDADAEDADAEDADAEDADAEDADAEDADAEDADAEDADAEDADAEDADAEDADAEDADAEDADAEDADAEDADAEDADAEDADAEDADAEDADAEDADAEDADAEDADAEDADAEDADAEDADAEDADAEDADAEDADAEDATEGEEGTDEEGEANLQAEGEGEEEATLQERLLPEPGYYADLTGSNVEVRVDSETGSGRITSLAEVLTLEEQKRQLEHGPLWIDVPNVGHTLINPGTGSKVVDTMSPRFFNDSDGNKLDDIGKWLVDVGYPDFVGEDGDDPNVCGDDSHTGELEQCPVGIAESECEYTSYHDDSWGFIDFECIEAGYFHIDIVAPDDTEETGRTLKFFCGGQAETAEISANPETVEIFPVGNSKGSSIITVAVEDQFGDRIDAIEVTFMTDNCKFSNPFADDEDDFGISPAGGGTTVTVYTDTDSELDDNFLTDNPLEHSAGTAEVSLDCATGTAGVAHVKAIIQRPGADIVLEKEIKVIGPTSVSGLTLTVTPEKLECGATIQAKARAVDSTGTPVSDGTPIYFTTDTSSGIVGGVEGAQGRVLTVNGEATALIATDPGKPGIHTVIAYVIGPAGLPTVQVSETYECEGLVAPVGPGAPKPPITPPSTGDAGLAAGGSTGTTLYFIVGLAAFAMAGLASVRFARN